MFEKDQSNAFESVLLVGFVAILLLSNFAELPTFASYIKQYTQSDAYVFCDGWRSPPPGALFCG